MKIKIKAVVRSNSRTEHIYEEVEGDTVDLFNGFTFVIAKLSDGWGVFEKSTGMNISKCETSRIKAINSAKTNLKGKSQISINSAIKKWSLVNVQK